MTVAELLGAGYAWADGHAGALLTVGLVVPLLGTALAWIGKRGRSEADGRWIASASVALALGLVVLEALAVWLARHVLGVSPLDGNVLLLLAPLACLGGVLAGVRLVFPLGELAAVRAAVDVGLLLAVGAGLLWLLSKFRGWGFVFFGTLAEFAVIGAVALELLRRLYGRATGARRGAPGGSRLPTPLAR
jgi:hypothetical protein